MKILLIAGHGDGDSGAVNAGFREDKLTRELALLCRDEIGKYAECEIADTSRNWFKYLGSEYYNFKPYDYVLELHFNSGAGDMRGNGRTTGVEIYVPLNESVRGVEEKILKSVASLGFTNRGVKRKNMRVISRIFAQGVSCALLEAAFIDDKDDMALYEAEKEEYARMVALGIAEGFGLEEEIDMERLENVEQKLEAVDSSLTNLYKSVNELIERSAELQKEININPEIFNYVDDNMPSWAREAVEHLRDKGILKGINEKGELGLTYNDLRMITMNYRAGVYK